MSARQAWLTALVLGASVMAPARTHAQKPSATVASGREGYRSEEHTSELQSH